jgi:hypothetical protein
VPPYDDRTHRFASKFMWADDATKQALEAFLNDPTPVAVDGSDDWTQAAVAYKHPLILALDRIVTEVNEAWAARMAHGMLNSPNTVDQREIDFRRGWYQGARYALRVIPFRANRRAMKALAEETEEVED